MQLHMYYTTASLRRSRDNGRPFSFSFFVKLKQTQYTTNLGQELRNFTALTWTLRYRLLFPSLVFPYDAIFRRFRFPSHFSWSFHHSATVFAGAFMLCGANDNAPFKWNRVIDPRSRAETRHWLRRTTFFCVPCHELLSLEKLFSSCLKFIIDAVEVSNLF